MKIAILGGNGFIGKYLVAKLHHEHNVCIITRQAQLDSCFNFVSNLTVFSKHCYSTEALTQVLRQHDVVINLIGILNEKGHQGKGFYEAHLQLSQKVVQACKANNIPRYLHMSALHADANHGSSFYLRSKGAAEDFVHQQHNTDFSVTSFCPSVVFGTGDSFCNRFAQIIRLMPLVFPLACANTRFAPVYASEVAEHFITAINDQSTYNKRIPLCGPQIYTLTDIVKLTADTLNKKRIIIPLPNYIAYMQAAFVDYCVPGKPFSIDNYNSLKTDSVCTDAAIGQQSLEEHIEKYLHLPLHEQNDLIIRT